MTPEKLKAIIDFLRSLAEQKTFYEMDSDYSPADNGNYDDAHSDGVRDGEIYMARTVLDLMVDKA
jgi:hypothetical protein